MAAVNGSVSHVTKPVDSWVSNRTGSFTFLSGGLTRVRFFFAAEIRTPA